MIIYGGFNAVGELCESSLVYSFGIKSFLFSSHIVEQWTSCKISSVVQNMEEKQKVLDLSEITTVMHAFLLLNDENWVAQLRLTSNHLFFWIHLQPILDQQSNRKSITLLDGDYATKPAVATSRTLRSPRQDIPLVHIHNLMLYLTLCFFISRL